MKYDIVIIGGGILGTTISYWLSLLSNQNVCVIEKEDRVAAHASSRNTGVVHSPFYLDPQKKGKIAKAALQSHALWKDFAKIHNVPWVDIGTIEIALDDSQHQILEKYLKWGVANGLNESDLELLNSEKISKKEPNVKCYSGIYCKKDVSTDYGMLTEKLQLESKKYGTEFLFNEKIKVKGNKILLYNEKSIDFTFLINCAGGHSLEIAKQFGVATEYSNLHFRGEYWKINPHYQNLVNTNVYSVAKFPNFPFLDPHWVRRADGTVEIGPNAVPVLDPEAYDGIGRASKVLSKFGEIISGSSKKLFFNPEFLYLVSKEWKSSISKKAMVNRVKEFIPKVKPEYFTLRGTAGIRTPIINKNGTFLPETLEILTESSLHVLNYNSPGATGAPAYSAHLVKKLSDAGIVKLNKTPFSHVWNFDDVTLN